MQEIWTFKKTLYVKPSNLTFLFKIEIIVYQTEKFLLLIVRYHLLIADNFD